MRIVLVALCLYMMVCYRAFASSDLQSDVQSGSSTSINNINFNNSTSTSVQTVKPRGEKKFSLVVDLSADSNMRDQNDSAYQANSSLYVIPAYRLSSQTILSARIGIEQKMYADDKTALSNMQIKLSRMPISIGQDRRLELAAFGVLPTNEDDRLKNNLQGATGLAAGVTQNYSVLKHKGSVNYTLSALKNYHEFSRTNELEPNINYRLRHIVTLEQYLSRKVSLEVGGFYQTGWTYENALHTLFSLSEKINFAVNDSFSVYAGVTNEGDALQANGIDSNVKLYDQSQSFFTMGLSATY